MLPVSFGKSIHLDIELLQKGEVGCDVILVAVYFSGNPSDGRVLKQEV